MDSCRTGGVGRGAEQRGKVGIRDVIVNFSPELFRQWLQAKAPAFRASPFSSRFCDTNAAPISLGVLDFPEQRVAVVAVPVPDAFADSRWRGAPLGLSDADAALVALYDPDRRFRLSLLSPRLSNTAGEGSIVHCASFFVDPQLPNPDFVHQFGRKVLTSWEMLQEAFRFDRFVKNFIREFRRQFEQTVEAVQGTSSVSLRRRFVLHLVLRLLFLRLVAAKGWFGGNQHFVQMLWEVYQQAGNPAGFYRRWLEPVFFESVNVPPAGRLRRSGAVLPPEILEAVAAAPYLHRSVFQRVAGVDDQGLWVPDDAVGELLTFLSRESVVLEENTPFAVALAVTPAFLAVVAEQLMSKKQGVVYTPPGEVALMCRLALLQWFVQSTPIPEAKLVALLFSPPDTESGKRAVAALAASEVQVLAERLWQVRVCDPAVGSGAFLVGMLQLLEQVLEILSAHPALPQQRRVAMGSAFARRRHILAHSLYGADLNPDAVWVCILRCWLAWIAALPSRAITREQPMLPSLDFKIRIGDALVQRFSGNNVPVVKSDVLSAAWKREIRKLERQKEAFFWNVSGDAAAIYQQERQVIAAWQQGGDGSVDVASRLHSKSCGFQQNGRVRGKRAAGKRSTEVRSQQQPQGIEERNVFFWSVAFGKILLEYGGFDIVIGNPPYLRKERIADPSGQLSPAAYRAALQQMVIEDFPDYFAQRCVGRRRKGGGGPQRRSDLALYFFIRSLRLLNDRGVLVLLCTNAWLEAAYARWLRMFLLDKASVQLVIENQCRRSFSTAEINTVITVIGAPLPNRQAAQMVRFVLLRQPLEHCLVSPEWIQAAIGGNKVDTEAFRIVAVPAEQLADAAENPQWEVVVGRDRWRQWYTPAAEVVAQLLSNSANVLVPLGAIAAVREGCATGANGFFFVPAAVVEAFGIESQYLVPAIVKTRGKGRLQVVAAEIDRYLLCLPPDESWMRKRVAAYVRYGEQTGVAKRRTLRRKKRWWHIPKRVPMQLLAPCGYGTRVWCAVNEARAVASNSFVEMQPQSPGAQYAILWTLNHPIGWLFLELLGRTSFGGGMLKVDPAEYRQVPVVRLPESWAVKWQQYALQRQVRSVFEECGIVPHSGIPIAEQQPQPMPDRRAFDNALFAFLGMSAEIREVVYRTVCQLVWDRVQRARVQR